MKDLQLVAERLVVRCREAVLQLELSVQRKLCEFDPNSADSFNQIQDYYSYLARLNSLHLRAEHIRLNLNHENKNPNGAHLQYETLESIISEFQRLTTDLNEMVRNNESPRKSYRSSSSKDSSSVRLKTLKIIERNRDSLVELSPSKIISSDIQSRSVSQKQSTFDESKLIDKATMHKYSSLPGSPIKQTLLEADILGTGLERSLRMAKSYDANLNKIKNKSQERVEFFKNKNRLSLSVFDEIDTDASDEETVISVTPPDICTYLQQRDNSKEKLRRCDSHESLLSTKFKKHEFNRKLKFCSPRWNISSNTATTSSNHIHSIAHSSNSRDTGVSRDLLIKLVFPKEQKNKPWFDTNAKVGLFSKWLGSSSFVTTETGLPPHTPMNSGRSIKTTGEKNLQSNIEHSSLIIGPNGSRFIRGLTEPLMNYNVSYNELEEALNTEFNF